MGSCPIGSRTGRPAVRVCHPDRPGRWSRPGLAHSRPVRCDSCVFDRLQPHELAGLSRNRRRPAEQRPGQAYRRPLNSGRSGCASHDGRGVRGMRSTASGSRRDQWRSAPMPSHKPRVLPIRIEWSASARPTLSNCSDTTRSTPPSNPTRHLTFSGPPPPLDGWVLARRGPNTVRD